MRNRFYVSLDIGMFLFMVISIASPLDANSIHILLCLVDSIGFAVGMGAISNQILKKTNLV